jgi:hypothetical protein
MGMLGNITIPCILYENCCLIDDNIRDLVEAQHLAITQDGVRAGRNGGGHVQPGLTLRPQVRWVVDRHATQCRCGFQEQGLISKVSRAVPSRRLASGAGARRTARRRL